MANQTAFTNKLLEAYSKKSDENTHLSLQIAQKDDEISDLRNQIQHLRAANIDREQQSNIQLLQQHLKDLQNKYRTVVSQAEVAKAQQDVTQTKLNKACEEQQDRIRALESQLNDLHAANKGSTEASNQRQMDELLHELEVKKTQLQTTQNDFARLQKQFQAEKVEHTRQGGFPAWVVNKQNRTDGDGDLVEGNENGNDDGDDDEDDEEPGLLSIKQESPSAQSPSAVVTESRGRRAAISLRLLHSSKTPTVEKNPEVGTREAFSQQAADISPSRYQNHTRIKRSLSRSVQSRRRSTSSGSNIIVASSRPPPPSPPLRPTAAKKQAGRGDIHPDAKRGRGQHPPHRTECRERKIPKEELEWLPNSSFKPRAQPRRCSTSATGTTERSNPSVGERVRELLQKFSFIAVTSHRADDNDDDSVEGFDAAEHLFDVVEALWVEILETVGKWEAIAGEEWKDDFEQMLRDDSHTRPCVSSFLRIAGRENGHSMWRAGAEGLYACTRCVRDGMPCFTWTGSQFWLLPLHEADRKFPVEDGLEIRYWVNVE